MRHSSFDTCLLARTDEKSVGFVAIQVNDTLIASNDHFLEQEEAELKKSGFPFKPLDRLTKDSALRFNGFNISIKSNGQSNSYVITQEQQIQRLQPLEDVKGVKPTDKLSKELRQQYIAQRARGAYIATTSQPERSFNYAYAAQYPDLTYEQL